MKSKELILGIDTSNYTTSVAITDVEGNILCDFRRLLSVKDGHRGLRQQEALFQHVNNLPELIGNSFESISSDEIGCICVSSRPRNVEGSYMPCFNAGVSAADMLGHALDVPVYEISHQQGHMQAAIRGSQIKDEPFIFCHLSGGTCEIIDVHDEMMEIAGGSLDISFGQLIDRTGVAMGFEFPCGKVLDEIACSVVEHTSILSDIKCSDGKFNLSGIETQVLRAIEKGEESPEFINEIFTRITRCLALSVTQVCKIRGRDRVLFAGGVASSRFLREHAGEYMDVFFEFGEPALCSDNAVGVSLLGGRRWQQDL